MDRTGLGTGLAAGACARRGAPYRLIPQFLTEAPADCSRLMPRDAMSEVAEQAPQGVKP